MTNVVSLNSSIARSKLNGVAPNDIIALFDYDLTLAEKLDPTNTDHAPLTAAHYVGLRDLAARIGRMVIITARGETSLLGYLGEHVPAFGRLDNTSAATNSGHRWHPLDESSKNVVAIGVPGISPTGLETLTTHIHGLVTQLKSEFPGITADHRELCGAVVFQFGGGENNMQFLRFQNRADELKAALPAEVREHIDYARKHWLTGDVMQGYIDMTPKGMSKGITTPVLFRHYSQNVCGNKPFVVAAGDSSADYAMMEALAKEVPADRRLFISVGDGLLGSDAKHAATHHGETLIDIVLTGDNNLRPVQELHAMLPIIGARQTKLDQRPGKSANGNNGPDFAG